MAVTHWRRQRPRVGLELSGQLKISEKIWEFQKMFSNSSLHLSIRWAVCWFCKKGGRLVWATRTARRSHLPPNFFLVTTRSAGLIPRWRMRRARIAAQLILNQLCSTRSRNHKASLIFWTLPLKDIAWNPGSTRLHHNLHLGWGPRNFGEGVTTDQAERGRWAGRNV